LKPDSQPDKPTDPHVHVLSEIDQMRSRFFANVSHEFRTPLTLILAPLETLLATAPPDTKEYLLLEMMQRNARRLLHLINQLMDLSKLEAGSLQLELKPGAVVGFLRSLAETFAPLAENRRVTFTYHLPESDWIGLLDADKLEKIVVNLLSNACKFTPDGGAITLNVRAENRKNGEADKDTLVITVTDNGIGIEPQQLERIFDRFYGGGSHIQSREGTGIGLALTKELVELYGGSIHVTSQAGQGAVFTVTLPLETADAPVSENPRAQVAHTLTLATMMDTGQSDLLTERWEEGIQPDTPPAFPPPEKPVVLIVEDNIELSAFIALQFRSRYQVLEATNGEAGWQKALESVPDIVISDVMMPHMDGIELSRKLKTDERTSHIPLILLTAKAAAENKMDGLQAGADDYLTKPFSIAELLVRVENLVEGRRKLRERYGRQITLQPAQIAVTTADERFLKRVIAIIIDHIDEADFTADAFEKEVGMSHVQFYRKMKSLTNQAPGEFLRNYRLQQAAMLLRGKHGSVSEVAYTVGFTSLAYFTRCFKALYGQTPSEYLAAQPT
jgi:CheY-like chemotaxis protein/two-component sensor histidine kinase